MSPSEVRAQPLDDRRGVVAGRALGADVAISYMAEEQSDAEETKTWIEKAGRTPLVFLGGAFYSIDMLPEPWRSLSLFNPVVYLISGMRWSFYGQSDVDVAISGAAIVGFLVLCLATVYWIFRTGWRLKQ